MYNYLSHPGVSSPLFDLFYYIFHGPSPMFLRTIIERPWGCVFKYRPGASSPLFDLFILFFRFISYTYLNQSGTSSRYSYSRHPRARLPALSFTFLFLFFRFISYTYSSHSGATILFCACRKHQVWLFKPPWSERPLLRSLIFILQGSYPMLTRTILEWACVMNDFYPQNSINHVSLSHWLFYTMFPHYIAWNTKENFVMWACKIEWMKSKWNPKHKKLKNGIHASTRLPAEQCTQ